MERKAIGKNISDLREAGIEIGSRRAGSYIECRDFEDSELKLLIDSVLQSKHITARHSKDLIEKLCGLSNKYFRSHVKNIHSVGTSLHQSASIRSRLHARRIIRYIGKGLRKEEFPEIVKACSFLRQFCCQEIPMVHHLFSFILRRCRQKTPGHHTEDIGKI